MNVVIFRENTEDIYAGIEFREGTEENKKFKKLLEENFPAEYKKMRFPDTAGIGVKPVSIEGTERLVRAAIRWALDNKRKSVNFVHKGNIMKFTEGAFKDWGYGVAKREFRDKIVTERESWILGNKEANPGLSVEDNARMVDPGIRCQPLGTPRPFGIMTHASSGRVEALPCNAFHAS
jgi:isocitrate dehydrogenase